LVQENDIHVDLSGLNTFLSFNRKWDEKKVCASLHDMAKPDLMNLHILILILLNGHKISCPKYFRKL
jgi:hypothetical protein